MDLSGRGSKGPKAGEMARKGVEEERNAPLSLHHIGCTPRYNPLPFMKQGIIIRRQNSGSNGSVACSEFRPYQS